MRCTFVLVNELEYSSSFQIAIYLRRDELLYYIRNAAQTGARRNKEHLYFQEFSNRRERSEYRSTRKLEELHKTWLLLRIGRRVFWGIPNKDGIKIIVDSESRSDRLYRCLFYAWSSTAESSRYLNHNHMYFLCTFCANETDQVDRFYARRRTIKYVRLRIYFRIALWFIDWRRSLISHEMLPSYLLHRVPFKCPLWLGRDRNRNLNSNDEPELVSRYSSRCPSSKRDSTTPSNSSRPRSIVQRRHIDCYLGYFQRIQGRFVSIVRANGERDMRRRHNFL